MTVPKPWSEGGEVSELTRELLLAGQSVRLPESERRALWAGIALALPIAAAPPTTPPGPLVVGAGLSGLLTKGVIFLAAVGGLTFGAARLWPHDERLANAGGAPLVAPTAVMATAEAATAASPTPLPSGDAATVAATTVSSESKQRSVTASQLREESVAVLDARSALRSGDAAKSLSLLEQARVRFPHGALGQEREALTIEALAQSGQTAAARRRAESFLRVHPTSPYATDVRRVAGQ